MHIATKLRSLSARACAAPLPAWLASAALALALVAPAPAAADVLSLYAAVQGGGAGGQGVDGEAQDEAFHAGVQGLAYGALVGAEVLFIDGWVEHTQHMRDGALAGTWTQFMVGLDTQIDLGAPDPAPAPAQPAPAPAAPAPAAPAPAQTAQTAGAEPAAEGEGEAATTTDGEPAAEQGAQAAPSQPPAPQSAPAPQPAPRKSAPGYAPGYIDLGLAAGFGVGTGQQVMPPLDNSELTDKGFLGQVHLGLGYRLTRALSVGVRVPVQAAYLFKSGEGAAANDRGNQYVSVNASVLVELRLNLSVR